MNVEFRINNKQFAASVYSGQTAVGSCSVGQNTVTNDDGSYTTTFEMFVAYPDMGSDGTGDITLTVGGVYETGFVWLFGGGENVASHNITEDGIVAIN